VMKVVEDLRRQASRWWNIPKLKEKLSVHCDYSGGLVFV
jgi:hypothetical protein